MDQLLTVDCAGTILELTW